MSTIVTLIDTMTTRTISAGVYLIIYLTFLAWYDGWGTHPLDAAEVEALLENLTAANTNPAQLDSLRRMGQEDDGEEFYMLNLNRYEYAEGEAQSGVPAAYQDYGRAVITMILRNAGHPIYSGTMHSYQIAGEINGEPWHEIILVRYRSRRDFISMVTSDEYQQIAQHRSGGIDYAEVTPTSAAINLVTPRLVIFGLLALLAWATNHLLRRNS